jgi:uncharacterized protein YjbJ (UPF0337 family)
MMGLPNKDEVKGKLDQIKGDLKKRTGQALNDRDLEDEGNADKAGGELREGFGTARRKIGEAVKDIGKAIGK